MPHDIDKEKGPKRWKRTVPRFKREEGKPHSTREGREAEAQRSYLRKHGERPDSRKRLAVTDKYKKLKPFARGYAKGGRTGYGIGTLVKGAKKIIKEVLKPRGVFKPKPVPKAVTDVDKPFKGYDKSYTKADDKKMDALLKKLGDEIKAQPLPSKLKKTMKKLQKAYPHKKAEGGRIGLKHGGSGWKFIKPKKTTSNLLGNEKTRGGGPDAGNIGHNKDLLRSGRPKIATKGWK